jgi:5-methylcytosine-specific restriction endonuclease McrA
MGMKRYPRFSQPVLRTKRWKLLRLEILERDDFACVKCGARGRLEVDHIRPVRDCPEQAFDPANLQTLCPSCHTAKTRIECGHKPPDPKRTAWAEAVRNLENTSEKRK